MGLAVPAVRFQILYVLLVLAHDRRRILHFDVAAHPAAEWTAKRLGDAFPWDTAPRSPWQRNYVERAIGSIRREHLDHVIVFGEESLLTTLGSCFAHYHRSRTYLWLGKDIPKPRPIQRMFTPAGQPPAGAKPLCIKEVVAVTAATCA